MNASLVVVLTVIETALGFIAGGLIGGFSYITEFITYITQYFIVLSRVLFRHHFPTANGTQRPIARALDA